MFTRFRGTQCISTSTGTLHVNHLLSFARNSRQRISGDARQRAVCEQAFSLYNTCPNRGHHHGMLLQPSAMKFAVCQLLYATSWNICFDLASLWRISAETSILAVIHTLCHTATKVMGQPSDMTETTAYLLCVYVYLNALPNHATLFIGGGKRELGVVQRGEGKEGSEWVSMAESLHYLTPAISTWFCVLSTSLRCLQGGSRAGPGSPDPVFH